MLAAIDSGIRKLHEDYTETLRGGENDYPRYVDAKAWNKALSVISEHELSQLCSVYELYFAWQKTHEGFVIANPYVTAFPLVQDGLSGRWSRPPGIGRTLGGTQQCSDILRKHAGIKSIFRTADFKRLRQRGLARKSAGGYLGTIPFGLRGACSLKAMREATTGSVRPRHPTSSRRGRAALVPRYKFLRHRGSRTAMLRRPRAAKVGSAHLPPEWQTPGRD